MNNKPVISRTANGMTVIYIVNTDTHHDRELTEQEFNALCGLLDEQEFEQHVNQGYF